MSKCSRNYNPYYRVKVRMSLVNGAYGLTRAGFKYATKDEADAKKAQLEEILGAAIRRQSDVFVIGNSTIRSDDLVGFKITVKDPDPVPEIDDDDDD